MSDEIVIPEPGAAPDPTIGFGDLIRYAPIIEEIIVTVEAAIAGGATTIPVMKIRVGGKRLTLGPTPIKVE